MRLRESQKIPTQKSYHAKRNFTLNGRGTTISLEATPIGAAISSPLPLHIEQVRGPPAIGGSSHPCPAHAGQRSLWFSVVINSACLSSARSMAILLFRAYREGLPLLLRSGYTPSRHLLFVPIPTRACLLHLAQCLRVSAPPSNKPVQAMSLAASQFGSHPLQKVLWWLLTVVLFSGSCLTFLVVRFGIRFSHTLSVFGRAFWTQPFPLIWLAAPYAESVLYVFRSVAAADC